MSFLKEVTWDVHLRLEKRLAAKKRFSDLPSYREHLSKLWAFQAAAEDQWAPLLQTVLDDFPARRKAHLLAGDIDAAGGSLPSAAAPVPIAQDGVAALGGFYVLEGATLGGQHLLPIVERKLGLSASHGASYLASYGPDVERMWQLFGAAVTAQCTTPPLRERAAFSARATFLALEQWLCGEAA